MEGRKEFFEITELFFKLGGIAFGGSATHIAISEDEVVKNGRWMTQEYSRSHVGATNLILGSNPTKMTMHSGHKRTAWAMFLIIKGSGQFSTDWFIINRKNAKIR